jgi:hypothetical protein
LDACLRHVQTATENVRMQLARKTHCQKADQVKRLGIPMW